MSVEGITRRQLAGLFAAFGVSSQARADVLQLELDHFKLRVSDLDRSVIFYYSLFGSPMTELQGGSYLTPPDMRAMFMMIGSGKTYMILSPPDSKAPVGLEHVSMDLAGMRIVARNSIPLAFPDQSYVRDPDGNLIEFVNPGYWWTPIRKPMPPLPPDVTNRKPVFEALAIQRIALRVSDLQRAADFYRLFGDEVSGAAPKDRRSFAFPGAILDLVSGGSAPGLDSFTVAVRSFDAASARLALGKLGSKATDENQPGRVSLRDPDGNRLEVVSA